MLQIHTPFTFDSDIFALTIGQPVSCIPIDGPSYIISMRDLTHEQRYELKRNVEGLLERYKNEKMERLNNLTSNFIS